MTVGFHYILGIVHQRINTVNSLVSHVFQEFGKLLQFAVIALQGINLLASSFILGQIKVVLLKVILDGCI